MQKVKRNPKRVSGVCRICTTTGTHLLVRRGGPVHAECLRMQTRGLLSVPAPRPIKDSTGEICRGCNQIIEAGDGHAHRQGKPFHRECLL